MVGEGDLIWKGEFGGWSRSGQQQLEAAYRGLDGEAAAALAQRAVEAVERRDVAGGDRDPVVVLARVTCFVPGALAGLHRRLLDADVLAQFTYPYVLQLGELFRGADAETRDRLRAIARDAPGERLGDAALASLAWINDDEVPGAFLSFREQHPLWAPAWFSADSYPLRAGWALLRDGSRKPLEPVTQCRRLERRAETGSPGRVISRLDQPCGGCSGPLTDLLDVDLEDERLGFLGLSGARLRVLTCERCVCFGTVYAEVDLFGSASWLEQSPQSGESGECSYLPERQLGLGIARRTPIESHAFEGHMSQLGGQAGWIQNPDYPQCPRCGELMLFLGQVDLNEFDLSEGMIYAFFHHACGVVATVFQQT